MFIDDISVLTNVLYIYVLQRLVDGVVKLKSDIKIAKKVPNITGCTLFLQVSYPFHAIATGTHNI